MKELAPLKMEEMVAPNDLVTKTEIIGKLPWYVEKYQGLWIWPTASQSPPQAVFVERLSPTEMTIAFAIKPAKGESASSYKYLREKLSWAGKRFSTKPEGPLEVQTSALISPFGHAMLFLTETNFEASAPRCFISSKHY